MILPKSYTGVREGQQRKRIRIKVQKKSKKKKLDGNFDLSEGVLKIPMGLADIVGPYQTKTVIPTCRIHGGGVKGIVPIGRMKGTLHSVTWGLNGRVRIQIYNCTGVAKMLGQKLSLVGVLVEDDTVIEYEEDDQLLLNETEASKIPSRELRSYEELDVEKDYLEEIQQMENQCLQVEAKGEKEKGIEVSKEKLYGLGDVTKEFLAVCDGSLYHGNNPWHKKLKICHREVQWLVPYGQIPLHNPGVNYITRDITPSEVEELVSMMLAQGVICRLSLGERALHSPVLLLRKPNGKIRKTVDYRVLNSYCSPWTTARTIIHRVLESIPKEWKIFSVLDLEQGFFQLKICPALQALFAFKLGGKSYTYLRLPQGWNSSTGLFHTKVEEALRGAPVKNFINDLITGERM